MNELKPRMTRKAADALSIFTCMRNLKLLALPVGEAKRQGFGPLWQRELGMRYCRKLGLSQGHILREGLVRKNASWLRQMTEILVCPKGFLIRHELRTQVWRLNNPILVL